MATSGTLTGGSWKTYAYTSSITGYANIQLTWSAVANVNANTYTINWSLKFLNRSGSSSGSGLGSGYTRTVTDWAVRVGKSSSSYQTYSSSGSVVAYNNYTLATGSATISADYDGSCNVYIYILGHIGGTGTTNQTVNSKTTALDQIPRGSTITCDSPIEMGTTQTVTVTQTNAGYSHILYYSIDGNTYTEIGRGTADATYNWSVPDTASSLPNADSTTYLLKTETYHSQDYTGDMVENTLGVIAAVPSAYVPSIAITNISEANTDIPSGFPYVQGYSKLKVETTFTGSYGSTCTLRKVTVGNETQQSDSASSVVEQTMTTALVETSNTVTAVVYDSRGRTGTATQTVTAEAYASPSVNLDCTRCLSDDTVDPTGEYLLVQATWEYSSINNLNSADIEIYLDGVLAYTYTTGTNQQSSLVKLTTLSNILAGNQYTVTAKIVDSLSSATVSQTIPKATIPLSAYDDGTDLGVTLGQMAIDPGFRLTQQMFDDGNLKDYFYVLAWTNPDGDSTGFATKSITLTGYSASDYSYYEIIYNNLTTTTRYMSSGKIPIGQPTGLNSSAMGSSAFRVRTRDVSTSTDGNGDITFSFAQGYQFTPTNTIASANTVCIPVYILLYY